MQFQRDEIINNLPQYGWQLVEIDLELDDWRFDEISALESVWSPVGSRAFVSFLVDAAKYKKNRRKGENIWAVAVSKSNPKQNEQKNYIDFSIGKGHWKETLREVFAELAKLRQRGLT